MKLVWEKQEETQGVPPSVYTQSLTVGKFTLLIQEISLISVHLKGKNSSVLTTDC